MRVQKLREARNTVRHVSALARALRVSWSDAADILGKLYRIERRGARVALRLCNGPEFGPGEVEAAQAAIYAAAVRVMGKRPAGFRCGWDPRGCCLRVESPGKAWAGAVRNGGGDAVLCPEWFS